MDAVKFLEERKRMYKSGAATPGIGLKDDYDTTSVVQIVERWSAAHPRKTRQDVFLEQWPNARLDEDGYLAFFPCSLEAEYEKIKCYNGECTDCRHEYWMKEVE